MIFLQQRFSASFATRTAVFLIPPSLMVQIPLANIPETSHSLSPVRLSP
jgi:hypothetical protein